jgi:hypothetical protein
LDEFRRYIECEQRREPSVDLERFGNPALLERRRRMSAADSGAKPEREASHAI